MWNNEKGAWELGFSSGIPIGPLTFLPYDDAPKGFAKISYHQETPIPLASFPDAVKLACPAEYNDAADFFFRANNADGASRSTTGTFLMLPAAARYFFRAFIKLWDAAVVPSDMDVQALVNEWSDMAGMKLNRSEAFAVEQI